MTLERGMKKKKNKERKKERKKEEKKEEIERKRNMWNCKKTHAAFENFKMKNNSKKKKPTKKRTNKQTKKNPPQKNPVNFFYQHLISICILNKFKNSWLPCQTSVSDG